MTTFTDYLDNPIHVGDVIIYPTATGSSSADMNLARVIEIDPLVMDHASGGWQFESNMRKSPSRRPYGTVRYPQRWLRGNSVDDPSKAYRLRIKRIRDGQESLSRSDRAYSDPDRIVTLQNVNRVTVVSGIVTFRPEDITHE